MANVNIRTPRFFIDLPNYAMSRGTAQNNNYDVEIGSYPFFRQGKLGVSIVLRSIDQNKIDLCNTQILKLVKEKNIEARAPSLFKINNISI